MVKKLFYMVLNQLVIFFMKCLRKKLNKYLFDPFLKKPFFKNDLIFS